MRVLVMGGTQFNGLALVHELARTGHDVTILNRGRTQAELPRGIRRLVADRTDPDAVRAALAGQDFDCVQDISAYRPEDVRLMTELLRGRTGHYVFASSTVIYAPSDRLPITEDHPVDRGEHQNEYGLNKLLCEDHLLREHRENGFPATIVAFSMVFGPNNILPDREQRMFVRLLQGRPVLIPGDGTTLGQVGHVDDEARALRMLMGNPRTFGRRYNLTGGDCFSDEGYVDTFAEVLGVEPRKVSIPAAVMDDLYAGRYRLGGGPLESRADTRAMRRDERQLQLFQINRIIQRIAPNLHHWNRSVFFSTRRLEQDVGWAPEYTFPRAVEQTWEWMRRTGRDRSLQFDFAPEDDLLVHIGA
ncbi:MAG: NAD-dependent epimerase/dehydratase family protein [Deltaproteobacteria bacterium]|nr:NAD-dependent epimerase/dehydratase family protein [Deltaproteobacteria bacterium]